MVSSARRKYQTRHAIHLVLPPDPNSSAFGMTDHVMFIGSTPSSQSGRENVHASLTLIACTAESQFQSRFATQGSLHEAAVVFPSFQVFD